MFGAKRTTSTLRRLAALALGASALGLPATALADDAQAESGFAVMANLGAHYYGFATAGGGTGGADLMLPEVGMTLGFKAGRILIGVGLDFGNSTSNDTHVAGNVTTSTTTRHSNFLIGPDFQIAILRSPDSRVELVGAAALHLGHQFDSTTISISPPPPPVIVPGGPTPSNLLLSYKIGPAVRFWAHKHFAIQATTGFGGQAWFDLPVSPAPATGDNSQHGIFASFGALGVF